jgi:hypothetical protein
MQSAKVKIKEDREFDVHGSVLRNMNLIERTNKLQPCSKICYYNVS